MINGNRDRILEAAQKAIDNAGGAAALAADILSLARDYGPDQIEADDEVAAVDIRLQIVCTSGTVEVEPSDDPDKWDVRVWKNSSDYDTDGRGYWGYGQIWANAEEGEWACMTAAESLATAEGIIGMALEHLASCI